MDKTFPQPREKDIHPFSPCHDSDGRQYHLVVMEGRHPYVKDAPLRVHGVSYETLDAARAKAYAEWNRAWVACHPSLSA